MAHARLTDPQTSHDAAASVTNISKVQKAILSLLQASPMCDEKLIEQYRIWQQTDDRFPAVTDQSIRSRRAELVKMGLLEPAHWREQLSTGNMGQVWRWVR